MPKKKTDSLDKKLTSLNCLKHIHKSFTQKYNKRAKNDLKLCDGDDDDAARYTAAHTHAA